MFIWKEIIHWSMIFRTSESLQRPSSTLHLKYNHDSTKLRSHLYRKMSSVFPRQMFDSPVWQTIIAYARCQGHCAVLGGCGEERREGAYWQRALKGRGTGLPLAKERGGRHRGRFTREGQAGRECHCVLLRWWGRHRLRVREVAAKGWGERRWCEITCGGRSLLQL